jgi:hypothetical protein
MISGPQNRWPAVVLEYEPHEIPEWVSWDRRFADGTLAPSGEYSVQVRVCDDHGLCTSATGRISIPDGIWPTVTQTPNSTVTSTVLPSVTPTRIKVVKSPTPIAIVPSPTPIEPVSHPSSRPVWQVFGLLGLMIMLVFTRLLDARPRALRRLAEVIRQISDQNQTDSSQDEDKLRIERKQ